MQKNEQEKATIDERLLSAEFREKLRQDPVVQRKVERAKEHLRLMKEAAETSK